MSKKLSNTNHIISIRDNWSRATEPQG